VAKTKTKQLKILLEKKRDLSDCNWQPKLSVQNHVSSWAQICCSNQEHSPVSNLCYTNKLRYLPESIVQEYNQDILILSIDVLEDSETWKRTVENTSLSLPWRLLCYHVDCKTITAMKLMIPPFFLYLSLLLSSSLSLSVTLLCSPLICPSAHTRTVIRNQVTAYVCVFYME
jgi:hypothetical protein